MNISNLGRLLGAGLLALVLGALTPQAAAWKVAQAEAGAATPCEPAGAAPADAPRAAAGCKAAASGR